MRHTSSRVRRLKASSDVWLRATEMEISAAQWVVVAWDMKLCIELILCHHIYSVGRT